MDVLFGVLVLLGFIAMLCAKLPSLNLPEWPAWLIWSAAAAIWAVPHFS